MMTSSSIEMVQLKLVKSLFSVHSQFQHTAGELISVGVSLKSNGEFFDNDSKAHFGQSFETTTTPSQAPFSLAVEFIALFTLSPPPLPLERIRYLKQVFPQIVFPYMQEYVADITRRAGFTPLTINHNIFSDEGDLLKDYNTLSPPVKWIH